MQLLIVVAIMAVLVCVAFVGITKARGRIRLANSAREFASYAEMARANAVRRHAQTSVQQVNGTTYSITMDFSGSGTVTTQNFATQTGVNINMPRTVTFDWRGRTPVETSIGFTNEVGTANVGITGSGDITIDAEIFHDGSIPTTVLTGTGGTVVPDPSPTPSASPSASPSPSPSSSPGASPSPTPVPSPNPSPSQSPTPNPTATPTPNPTPTPTPATSPTPTPTVAPCTFSVSASSITVAENGSATVTAHYNNHTGSGTITATSSNSGQIQVSPGSATVSGTSSASFTITVKKQSGSVTFASSCGSATVTVTVP